MIFFRNINRKEGGKQFVEALQSLVFRLSFSKISKGSMPFEFIPSKKINGPIIIKPLLFNDERGMFMETYKRSEFISNGIVEEFVQDNYSVSKKWVLRGLHYQKNPNAQAKLVSCIRGKVFDVAVDIRKGSPTYGRWISCILSEKNRLILYIPKGFAHGFLALSDVAEIQYKCSCEYSQKDERGIIWNDPALNIRWPTNNPTLSKRDKLHPPLKYADNNFFYENQK